MSVATVQFDYDPDKGGPGDLVLKKGEVILITEKSHTGIWKGKKKDGSVGSFPSNYIKVVQDANAVMFYDDSKNGSNSDYNANPNEEDDINGLVFAKVLTSFDSSKLNFESEQNTKTTRFKKPEKLYIDIIKGTVVEVLSKEPNNWTKIEYNGEKGLVPSNHIQILETKAKVLYDFKPAENQSWLMEIKRGDMITVQKQNPSGWWNGITSSGKSGLFPGNYVRILQYLSNGELDMDDDDEEEEEQYEDTPQETVEATPPERVGTMRHVKSEVDEKKIGETKMPINNKKAKVLKTFEASKKDQIDVTLGEIVVVTGKYTSGWWEVQNKDGLTGLIPGDLVEILSESTTKEIVRVYSALNATTYWTLAINSLVDAREVCGMIAEKLGVEDYFFLFETQGTSERRLLDNERPADIVASWKASEKANISKLVIKQQQTAIGGNKIAAVTNPDNLPKNRTVKEPPVPLPMKVMRFYSLNPDYTYWTLGINPFLTAKDVRETIARKLELDVDFLTILVEIDRKSRKLADTDSVVDVSNTLENRSYRFTVDILNAKERRLYEAKKKHESNVLEREKEAEIRLALEAEERKKLEELARQKKEEEDKRKLEEDLRIKKLEEEAKRKEEEIKRKEEEERRKKENEEKRKRDEELRRRKEEENRKNQEELQRKFEERKRKEAALSQAAASENTEIAPTPAKSDYELQIEAELQEAQRREDQAKKQREEEEATRQEEEARLREGARLAKIEEEAKILEESRIAEEAKRAEEARIAEEAKREEEARIAEEAKILEEARLKEEKMRQEEELAKRRAIEQKIEEERLKRMKEQEDEIKRLQEEAEAFEMVLQQEAEKLKKIESEKMEVETIMGEKLEQKSIDDQIKEQEKILLKLEQDESKRREEQQRRFYKLREEAQMAATQHSSIFEMEEKERIEREQAVRKLLDEGTFVPTFTLRRVSSNHPALEERRRQEQQRISEQQKAAELRDKSLYEDREINTRRNALERLSGSPYASRVGSTMRFVDIPNDDQRRKVDEQIEADVEVRRQLDKKIEEEGAKKIEAFLFTRGLGEERKTMLDSTMRRNSPGASFKNTLGFFQKEDAKTASVVSVHTKQFKEQLDDVMTKSELSRRKFEQELADSKRSFEKQLEDLHKKSDI